MSDNSDDQPRPVRSAGGWRGAGATPDVSASRPIKTYLRDHRAGATAGVRLAARCRDEADDARREVLTAVAAAIDEDRQTLDALLTQAGVAPSRVKMLVALGGELVGRLKLNGRLTRRSPVAPLLELEALAAGVHAKRCLWVTLGAGLGHELGLDDARFDELVGRADDQLERLRSVHREVASSIHYHPNT